MPTRDDLSTLAQQEADDTFKSIGNLDDISDTIVVALTFFLSAIGVWVGVGLDRVSNESFRALFVALAVVCTSAAGLGLLYILRSLAPRSFHGDDVGTRFVDGWVPPLTTDHSQLSRYRSLATENTELSEEFRDWLEATHTDEMEVENMERFQLVRFFNYKLVARTKARHTAYGILWIRIAVLLLIVLVTLGLVAPLFPTG